MTVSPPELIPGNGAVPAAGRMSFDGVNGMPAPKRFFGSGVVVVVFVKIRRKKEYHE